MCIVVFLSLLDAATAEIYTLSLHDALPISELVAVQRHVDPGADVVAQRDRAQQVRAPAPLALGHRQRRRHDGAAGMADRKASCRERVESEGEAVSIDKESGRTEHREH